MAKHMIPFGTTVEGDKELIELAFSKKKADERKEWLRQFKVCFLVIEFGDCSELACSLAHTWTTT